MIKWESFRTFWLKLTHLIDYGIIDWMWEFGTKLSESIDYIVIDRFEIIGNYLILSRGQDQTRNSKNMNWLVSMRRIDLCFGLWPHPWGHTRNKESEINRFWLLESLGIEIDWHRYESWRCSQMMLMKQETRRISRGKLFILKTLNK